MKSLPIILIGIVIFVYMVTRRKETVYDFDPSDPKYIRKEFDKIRDEFSASTLKMIEKIYRLETGHFKSGQYLSSLSAGLVYSIDNQVLPWNLSNYNTIGISKGFKVGGKVYRYVMFPNLSEGLRFLGDYIDRTGNPYRWVGTNPTLQNEYAAKLSNIKTSYA